MSEQQLGFANSSAVFYRHFVIDRNTAYNLTVTPVRGNPVILIKVSNSLSYPFSADPSTYDVRVDSSETGPEYFRIDPDWRYDQDIFCDRAGYPMNGGNTLCTLYIAVECPEECVFRVSLEIEQVNASFTGRNVPIYLTDDNYFTGVVGPNQTKYFYYPVSKERTGETIIFLNKTGPLWRNGNSRLVLAVQGNAENSRVGVNQTNSFYNWFYPNRTAYRIDSTTVLATQPEMIEICNRTYDFLCTSNTSCVLVIGVIGTTPNMNSNFRIIA